MAPLFDKRAFLVIYQPPIDSEKFNDKGHVLQ